MCDGIRQMCERYFEQKETMHQYVIFQCGEAVLAYCKQEKCEQIDVLFLDVEMPGMNGIDVKNRVSKSEAVQRIVFVSGHEERIMDAFGKKTVGFISKPPQYEKIKKILSVVEEECAENVEIVICGQHGEKRSVMLGDIAFFKADGSYTEIVTYSSKGIMNKELVVCKKLGEIEKSMCKHSIIRVHKSFLVNLVNVVGMGEMISLRNSEVLIPIGRAYKESVKKAYFTYEKDKMRKLL